MKEVSGDTIAMWGEWIRGRGIKEGWNWGGGMLEKNEGPPADWDWSAFCSTFFKDIPRNKTIIRKLNKRSVRYK